MRIGVVGGLDRMARDLFELARAGGHQIETHTGVLRGRASAASLRALVGRSDVVVILTDINSHNGVRAARQYARRMQRQVRLARRLGASQFEALLAGLGGGVVPVIHAG